MKYEYTMVVTAKNPLETIKEHSDRGWECFSVVPSLSDSCFRELYFRKLKGSTEKEKHESNVESMMNELFDALSEKGFYITQ